MENIIIRDFKLEDAEALLQMNIENKDYFEKWMPVLPPPSFYTLEGQIEKIKSTHERSAKDEAYSFGIFLESSNTLIGDVSFAFIRRGPFQTAMLGYGLSQKFTGKGYATKAVTLALDIAFKELKLHRVIAEAQPENMGSVRVLEKAGFTREGYARKNLLVNGEWKDHVAMAILYEDRF
jgi:ribosomal-protein-alanine N-acetyltransferase